MRSLIIIVCVISLTKAGKLLDLQNSQSLGDELSEAKTLGFHTTVDGASYLWANTSAVSTAGFFGNAALFLTALYFLSHSDQIVEVADQLITGDVSDGNTIIDNTMDSFNENFANIGKNIKKATSNAKDSAGVMMSVVSGLKNLVPKNPMQKLKDTFFPAIPKETITSHTVRPSQSISPTQNQDIDFSSGFVMNFFKEPQFDFGKRKENSNEPKILILPSNGERQSDRLPFIEDYDPEYDLEVSTDLDAQLKQQDDNLSEIDLDEFEKQRIWAENFLKTYNKMKEMLKKREIEEKEMKELQEKKKRDELKENLEVQNEKKEQKIVKTESKDMKAMILNMLKLDWIVPRLQQMIELQPFVNVKNVKRPHEERLNLRDRDTKDVTPEETDTRDSDSWRIPDEDLQYLIDAQLSNFESFKIPKKTVKSREIEELEALRSKAKDLYRRQMSLENSQVETETATTPEQEETTTEMTTISK